MPSTRAQAAREQADLNKAIQDSETAFAGLAEQQLSEELATTLENEGIDSQQLAAQQNSADTASTQSVSRTDLAASTSLDQPDHETILGTEDVPDWTQEGAQPTSSDSDDGKNSETKISVTTSSKQDTISELEPAAQDALPETLVVLSLDEADPVQLHVAVSNLQFDNDALNHSDDNEIQYAASTEANESSTTTTTLVADTKNLSIVESESNVASVNVVEKPTSLTEGTGSGGNQGDLSHPPVSSRTRKLNKTSVAVSPSKKSTSGIKSALTRLAKANRSGSAESTRVKSAYRLPGEQINQDYLQLALGPVAVSSPPPVTKKTVVTTPAEEIKGGHEFRNQDTVQDGQAAVTGPAKGPAQPLAGKKNTDDAPAKAVGTRRASRSIGTVTGSVTQATNLPGTATTTTFTKKRVKSKFRL